MADWSLSPCSDKTDLFYTSQIDRLEGDPLDPRRKEKEQEARSLCAVCPNRFECLLLSIERGETYGIWGGLDYYERRIVAVLLGHQPPNRKAVTHGTEGGAGWHRRKGIPMCEPCRLAYNEACLRRVRKYRKKKRQEERS